jgi:hypothetical protein
LSLSIAVMISGGSWDVPARLFLFSLVPTAAIIGVLSRRFRGVGALVLGTMMVASPAPKFAFAVLGNEVLITSWAEMLTALGVTRHPDVVSPFAARRFVSYRTDRNYHITLSTTGDRVSVGYSHVSGRLPR